MWPLETCPLGNGFHGICQTDNFICTYTEIDGIIASGISDFADNAPLTDIYFFQASATAGSAIIVQPRGDTFADNLHESLRRKKTPVLQ